MFMAMNTWITGNKCEGISDLRYVTILLVTILLVTILLVNFETKNEHAICIRKTCLF